jgi:hypothetical protein
MRSVPRSCVCPNEAREYWALCAASASARNTAAKAAKEGWHDDRANSEQCAAGARPSWPASRRVAFGRRDHRLHDRRARVVEKGPDRTIASKGDALSVEAKC